MILVEPIQKINYNLEKEFGRFDNRVNFRVVFADDEYEKRWTSHDDNGNELLHPEVRLVPKYKQMEDFAGRYILERLVPTGLQTDLTTQTSYEPAWVFRDAHGNYLPPQFDMCKFVIEALLAAAGHKAGFAKYKDPLATKEAKMQHIKDVEAKLFGDETAVGDALTHGYGVTVPKDLTSSRETNASVLLTDAKVRGN